MCPQKKTQQGIHENKAEKWKWLMKPNKQKAW